MILTLGLTVLLITYLCSMNKIEQITKTMHKTVDPIYYPPLGRRPLRDEYSEDQKERD